VNDASHFEGGSARQEHGRGAGAQANSAALCGIAIMAKASTPGRTKTRLVPPLTHDEAAAINTAFLQDAADNILLAGLRASIAGYAAHAPAGSEDFFRRILPSRIGLIEACLPTLGECLVYTIEQVFSRGHGSAIVLNADSPTLPTLLLIEAADALAQPGERVVLGPADDGGYYLLGLKTVHRRLFEDIAWSTEHVAAQTLDRAREIKLDVHRLTTWYDVDDVASLRRLHREICRPRGSARGSNAHSPRHPPATAALMRRLWAEDEIHCRRQGAAPAAAENA
jgi:rSAM/selenodomain-associated transferase 1